MPISSKWLIPTYCLSADTAKLKLGTRNRNPSVGQQVTKFSIPSIWLAYGSKITGMSNLKSPAGALQDG